MSNLIRELRRREVFRAAGLYVGIAWILIEAASVFLPAFEAPDWVMRAFIIVAIIGLPIVIVLAWIYDVTDHGIEVQGDATDTVVIPFGGRKGDFIVIGVLSVALIFSVYLNVTREGEPVATPDPVSILIADFGNNTGNPMFDGLLEQALAIGVEGAPHITSYQRNSALRLATKLQSGVDTLTAEAARLVAVREGINLVLTGTIDSDGSGFELGLAAINPATGEAAFEVSSNAKGPEAVLTAVGLLSEDIREELGDTTLDETDAATAETFTAASLEAAQAYTSAIDAAFNGDHEQAVQSFEKATSLDPNFGRAFSGWALSEFKLGRTEKATELWNKALSLMDTMTDRERLRTLGLYYVSVTGNFKSAVQSFSELVEKYPADAAGHNNLAVSAFYTRDFATASKEGRLIMEIYPASELYQSNFALYAMYSGDFEAGADVANKLIADNPAWGAAYLPVAVAAMATGDYDAARVAYDAMSEATASHLQGSIAHLGLADLAIYAGKFAQAQALLLSGIEQDLAAENQAAAAAKQVALAETLAAAGDLDAASAAASTALDMSSQDSVRIAAARVYLAAGDKASAAQISGELTKKIQSQSRAYGLIIQAAIAREDGRHAQAADLLRNALDLADLWLIRFELGKTFLAAGLNAEALEEFMHCDERRGEASAIFLDDTPSYRYMAEMPYWISRAQQGLGMDAAALDGYNVFLERRPEGGPLADDARQRMNE